MNPKKETHSIKSKKTHWGCIWDLVTTFGDGLGHIWPHSFNSVNANVSWAILEDCLLNWRPMQYNRKNPGSCLFPCKKDSLSVYRNITVPACLLLRASFLPTFSNCFRTLSTDFTVYTNCMKEDNIYLSISFFLKLFESILNVNIF